MSWPSADTIGGLLLKSHLDSLPTSLLFCTLNGGNQCTSLMMMVQVSQAPRSALGIGVDQLRIVAMPSHTGSMFPTPSSLLHAVSSGLHGTKKSPTHEQDPPPRRTFPTRTTRGEYSPRRNPLCPSRTLLMPSVPRRVYLRSRHR